MKNLRYNNILLRALTILCLMMASMGAWATDYVFVYNGNYLGVNAAGNAIQNYTTFNPTYCIWTCDGDLDGTSRALYIKVGTNTRYLNSSTTNGGAPTLANNAQNVWRANGTRILYRNGNTDYYLYNRDGWKTSSQGSPSYGQRNNTAYYMGYVIIGTGTDYRATITASSTTTDDQTTPPTISYNSYNGTTITLSRTNLTGTYTSSTTITVGGTTYYKGSNGAYSNTAPSATLNPTYTWSVTSGNASITQAGAVTPNNNITNNITVRLTTTNADPALTKTTNYTINVSSTAEATTYSGGLNAVTPANNSITYNANTGITLDSPARKKNTTAAYQTYTASGNTFYRVNNNFQAAAPTATSTDVAVTSYSWALSGAGATNAQLASATGTTNTLTYKTASPSDVATTVTVTANYAEGGNVSKNANVTLRAYVADPTAIAADDIKLRVGETLTLNPTLSCAIPSYTNIYRSLSYSSANTGIATVNATTGVVTGVAKGTTTITITAALQGGGSITKKINVTVAELAVAPTITFDNTTGELTMSSSTPGAEIHYTLTGSDPTSGSATYNDASKPVLMQGATVKAITVADGYLNSNVTTLVVEQVATPTVTVDGTTVKLASSTAGVTYYYTTDGSEPTLSSTNTTSTTLTTIPSGSTLKVMAVKNGMINSEVASKYIELSLATPTITIDGGKVTMTSPDGATIHYTTDGSTPTASSPTYSAPLTATNGVTYKAIAIKAGFADSEVAEEKYMIASGTDGGTVTINDYEDHTWTYYAGVNSEVDGGHYNTNYKGKLYSPNPRNVQITYNGVNGISGSTIQVKVSTKTGEGQNSFVYYKTLEEGATAGQYPYQVISNPFSVRPSTGTGTGKVFYGFNGWKIKSGGKFIRGYNDGQTLPLDAEIVFENLDQDVTYTPNCTSAEIVFETTWTQATVQRGGANVSNVAFDGGNYEKNFCVINANYNNALTPTYPVTIMGVEPDGSATYNNTIGGTVTPVDGADNMTKLEYVTWNPGAAINSRGRNFTIGRGVTTSGTARALYGTNSNAAMNQVLKVESGNYASFISYNTNPSSLTKHHVTFGNDYDRAKNDNSKLAIPGEMRLMESGVTRFNTTAGKELAVYVAKSGVFTEGLEHASARASANDFYLWDANNSNTHVGYRKLVIEGGEFYHIGGGMDKSNTTNIVTLDVRMKGGTLHGCIYGGGATYDAAGHKVFVFTGGKVEGWIAPGANGQVTSGTSVLNGATYVYVGGNTRVDSNGSNTSIDASVGGNVFGAGCGNNSNSTRGIINQGTNVVMADEAYVERGVYGGGAYGLCKTDQTANIYMTGGTIGSVYDTTYKVYGGIYGGARQNNGGAVNIYMTGGLIKGYTYNGVTGGGLFGGSNDQGTINLNVNIRIDGGQIGTSSAPANIHGGGFGQNTVVSGNVEMTLGKLTDERGAKIYGNVYGGSALGTTGGNTKHTYVTVNRGSITGDVFGGGMGENGSDTKGVVTGTIAVDVYGTDPAPDTDTYALHGVYGGGDLAPYAGTPTVKVHNCDNSIEYVYGGGNATSVAGTDVTIYGGNKIGNVFGGGNGQVRAANVTGGTNVKIYGGTIGDVYGGSNTQGTIGGTINVSVNAQAEGGNPACPIDIDNVYGGGNKAASAAGNITIGCAEHIGAVYGGANQANVTGDITLNIVSGHIDNVFGGNNNSGQVSGNITVTVNDNGSSCGMEVGNVYGGGNIASIDNGTPRIVTVNIPNATVSGSVFGGGKGKDAVIVGETHVNIGDWSNTTSATINGDVFGGGDLAAVEGPCAITIRDCNTQILGDLYGGGNAAPVYSTNTTMWGGLVAGNVFGGGNGQDTTLNPNGAQVGYKRDDTFTGGTGVASTAILGGTVGTWVDGACTDGTGGVFGGSNTNGNIRGGIALTLDQQACTEDGATQCSLKLREIYGAGNEAAYAGTGINFDLGCVDYLEEIYGGAKAADLNADAVLTIRSGHFKKVFGGNNVSGKLNGKIEVNVDETGCNPIIIEELYGGGNLAAYSIYGYEGTAPRTKEQYDAMTDEQKATEGLTTPRTDPLVNIISCTRIDNVYGGGYGETAVMVGSPTVTINQILGAHASEIDGKLGAIGIVFGGGNAAKVIGDTYVNVGTIAQNAHKQDAQGTIDTTLTAAGANITGNVYGGGNKADVTGKTNVTVGK